jgi:hypothetical protein
MKSFLATLFLSVMFVGSACGGDRLIAYLDNAEERDDVISKLLGTGLMSGSIDTFHLGSGTPALAHLLAYDSVFVFNCCNPIQDAVTFGNNLADYVDAGGGVVLADWGLGGAGGPAGRWRTGGYQPVVIGDSGYVPTFDTIGTRHFADHPILDGVATLAMGNWDGAYLTRPPAPGTTRIADWASGHPLIVEMPGFNGRIIGLNLYPPSSSLDPRFWNVSTDGDILMANAINYVARVPEPSSICMAIGFFGAFLFGRRYKELSQIKRRS